MRDEKGALLARASCQTSYTARSGRSFQTRGYRVVSNESHLIDLRLGRLLPFRFLLRLPPAAPSSSSPSESAEVGGTPGGTQTRVGNEATHASETI
jgi:hypothetical protein